MRIASFIYFMNINRVRRRLFVIVVWSAVWPRCSDLICYVFSRLYVYQELSVSMSLPWYIWAYFHGSRDIWNVGSGLWMIKIDGNVYANLIEFYRPRRSVSGINNTRFDINKSLYIIEIALLAFILCLVYYLTK